MSRIYYIGIAIFLLGCKTQQKTVERGREKTVIHLRIVFSIDQKTYNYQFRFTNESKDTVKIVKPQIDQGYSRFSRISADTVYKLNACGSYSIYKVGWIELIPYKETVVKGAINLQTYFCEFNENELISYYYQGAFERKDGTGGQFSFDIQPTTLSKVDSITILKLLF